MERERAVPDGWTGENTVRTVGNVEKSGKHGVTGWVMFFGDRREARPDRGPAHTHTHPGTIPWREEEEWWLVLRPPRLDFAAGVPRKRGNDGTDDDPCGR